MARDATSLRAVARAIGITPMGLSGFLASGSNPQARTVRKLNSWYVRRMATRPPEGEDEARAALTILAGYYPQKQRFRVLGRVLDSMEAEFRESGLAPPAWLGKLRAEIREGAE